MDSYRLVWALTAQRQSNIATLSEVTLDSRTAPQMEANDKVCHAASRLGHSPQVAPRPCTGLGTRRCASTCESSVTSTPALGLAHVFDSWDSSTAGDGRGRR